MRYAYPYLRPSLTSLKIKVGINKPCFESNCQEKKETFTCWVNIHDPLKILYRLLSSYEQYTLYSSRTDAMDGNLSLCSRNTFEYKSYHSMNIFRRHYLRITFFTSSTLCNFSANRKVIIHTQTQRLVIVAFILGACTCTFRI